MNSEISCPLFAMQHGQHVALIGDTGTGKTTLAEAAFQIQQETLRKYVLALRSKPDDVAWRGFARVRSAMPAMGGVQHDRILLEPPYERQPRAFAEALELVWRQEAWTVFVDDLPYVEELGAAVQGRIKRLLTMGRSKSVSMWCAMQRPTGVTRYAIGESRLTVSFMIEGRDVDELVKSTNKQFGEACEQLDEHDVAMFWRPTREVWVGRLIPDELRFEGVLLARPASGAARGSLAGAR